MVKKIRLFSVLAIIVILLFTFSDLSMLKVQSKNKVEMNSAINNGNKQASFQIEITQDPEEDPNKKLDLLLADPEETNDRIGFTPQY
jgi:hypothetical protein